MSKKEKGIIYTNRIFGYLALVTGVLLSIPFLAMKYRLIKPDPSNQLDKGVNWNLGDFILMGILIFGMGSLFIAISRIAPKKYQLLIGFVILAAFLLIWAHLAVGIVDTWPLAGS